MSTAANCKPEYIPDINQFYYSKSGTNSFSIKDPEIRPRSIKKDYVVADIPHPQKISIQNQLIENYVAI